MKLITHVHFTETIVCCCKSSVGSLVSQFSYSVNKRLISKSLIRYVPCFEDLTLICRKSWEQSAEKRKMKVSTSQADAFYIGFQSETSLVIH